MSLIKRFIRSEDGPTATEYAVMLALIIVVCITAVTALGTKVQGIFTADPVKDPNAEFIPALTFQEVVTRELGVMDAAAVSLCKENRLPIIVLSLEERGAVTSAIRGERVGTLVS